MYLLSEIRPAFNIFTLINTLEMESDRQVRHRFSDHPKSFYRKPSFSLWSDDVGSVGGATQETLRRYVEKP